MPRRFKNKIGIFKNKNQAQKTGTKKGAALKVKKPLKRFNKPGNKAIKANLARSLSKGDRKQRLQEKLARRNQKKNLRVQGKTNGRN